MVSTRGWTTAYRDAAGETARREHEIKPELILAHIQSSLTAEDLLILEQAGKAIAMVDGVLGATMR